MSLSIILNNDYLTCFGRALRKLLDLDHELLFRRVKEEAINHRLAVYLEHEFKSRFEYSWLSVDVEYNKNYAEHKNIIGPDGSNIYIRPDILVHQRGDNYNNKLAVECKLDYIDNSTKYKLKCLMEDPYNYENSIGIVYRPQMPHVNLHIATKDSIVNHKILKADFNRL